MHVDVILTQNPLQNPNILSLTNLNQKLSKPALHITIQHVVSVFRDLNSDFLI